MNKCLTFISNFDNNNRINQHNILQLNTKNIHRKLKEKEKRIGKDYFCDLIFNLIVPLSIYR